LDAARAIGAGHRVGSIEVGKDADLLILDGDPLHYKTFVEIAVVNGKIVYEKDKEPFYSHIRR
jgi:imidazolonepropionase-like amidohydrolase